VDRRVAVEGRQRLPSAQPNRARGQALKRGGRTCRLHGLSTARAVMAGRPLQREFTVRARASTSTATHRPMAPFVPISYAHSNALRGEGACAVQGYEPFARPLSNRRPVNGRSTFCRPFQIFRGDWARMRLLRAPRRMEEQRTEHVVQ
jgi:hypothetical protein